MRARTLSFGFTVLLCLAAASCSNETAEVTSISQAAKPGGGATPPVEACKSCHGTPPRSHVQGYDCGKCHLGYTANSTNPADHRNRVVNVDYAGTAVTTCNSGLAFQILSATVAEGLAPTITFAVTDPTTGAPVDLLAEMATSPVTLAPRFTLAYVQPDGKYRSYKYNVVAAKTYTKPDGTLVEFPLTGAPTATQAAAENAAAIRTVAQGGGVYTYTFASPVTGVSASATHTATVFGARALAGCSYPASATYDFTPSGGAPTSREVVAASACNTCHGNLQAHGTRRGVKMCLTCHSPQTTDPETGHTVDFAVLVHKIHAGARLANGYPIVAHLQTYFDVTDIAMAPSHSTYFELVQPTGATNPPIVDAGIVRECGLCHQGAQGSLAQTNPSRAACGACHDTVDFATGTNHSLQSDDSACAGCHTPAAIEQVHSSLYETSRNLQFQPHTLAVHIEDVANVGPGLTPAITFTVAVDGAPYDFRTNKLGALTFMMAGPTTDYAETFTVNCLTNNVANANCTAVDAAAGRFKATFPASAFGTGATGIPSDRTGSYVFTFEAYYFQQLSTEVTGVSVRKPFAANPEFVAKALTGSPTPRRVVASKCNSCHVDLGFHSNRSRKGASYCATCHNPNLDNSGRMRFLETEAPYLVESVSMNVYIHRIHMGAELPSVLAGGKIRYGTNRTATDPTPGAEGYADLSKFESPSPMGNCATCHDGDSFALPELPGLLPNKRTTMTCADPAGGVDGSEWCNNRVKGAVVITPPLKAVCTSCHDGLSTTTHADLNTLSPNSTGAVELCSGCHGLGKEWDSLVVHEPIP